MIASSPPRTIVIVGGVAGGASAATRARRVNEHARIILFEKDPDLSFANCGLPYYLGGEIIQRDKLLVATPEFLAKRFRIEAHPRHQVTAIDRPHRLVHVTDLATGTKFSQRYDRLILATGATPIIPPIQGVESNNLFTLRNLVDTDRIRSYIDLHRPGSAVVVGAGFIGLEMVEQLHRHGLSVSLVELLPQVLPPLDPEMAHLVQEELERRGIALHLGDGIEGLRTAGDRVSHVLLKSGQALPTDMVIMAIGVRPNTALAKAADLELGPTGGIKVNTYLQTSDPYIYAVGDAAELTSAVTGQPLRVPLAGPANRAGRLAGEHAATGHCAPMSAVLGTAIVRVFGVTAAITGLTTRSAAKADRRAQAVILESGNHAGYFPGAKPMMVKLVFDPFWGKVLGAQIVGSEGVDKRIDVIAAVMHFGGSVNDLINLDLAYAPPFGSAKDPVHMAGYVAANRVAGLVEFLPPDTDLAGMQVLDVRTAAERAEGAEPGSLHIPLDELRDRMHELDRSRPIVIVCRSGLRGYLAARILHQHGFEHVTDVTGGMLARKQAAR